MNLLDDSEDSDLVSADEMSPVNPNPVRGAHLDFQVKTRFGQLSLTVQPSSKKPNQGSSMPADNFKPINQQNGSLFFTKLPPELRLRIYELHLRSPTTSKLDPRIRTTKVPIVRIASPSRSASSLPSTLTLLLICRRILDEAEGIFYTANRLSTGAIGFFLTIGPARRNAITTFALPAQSPGQAHQGLQYLRQWAPNLRSLDLLRDKVSARYIDVKAWAVMAPQLISEIERMQKLEEVEFIEAIEAREFEEGQETERVKRLAELDRKICGAASCSRRA